MKGAIAEKLEAHKKNHTWDLVPLPEGHKTILKMYRRQRKKCMDLSDDLEVSKERGKEGLVCRLTPKGNIRLEAIKTDLVLKVRQQSKRFRFNLRRFRFLWHEQWYIYIACSSLCWWSADLFKLPKLKLWIKEKLFQIFEMKNLGELKYCLDIEIYKDRVKGNHYHESIHLHRKCTT